MFDNISFDKYKEICREVSGNRMTDQEIQVHYDDLKEIDDDTISPGIEDAVKEDDKLYFYDDNYGYLKESNVNEANEENYECVRKFFVDVAIQKKVYEILGIKVSLGDKTSILTQALSNPSLHFIKSNWDSIRQEMQSDDFEGPLFQWKLKNPHLFPRFNLIKEQATPNEFGSRFNELRVENKFTDATIIVDNERFNVHRCMLSSSSPFFERLFSSSFNENIVLKENGEVALDAGFPVASRVFEKYLTFVYTRVVGDLKDFSVEDVIALGSLAHMTLIDDLKSGCMDACSKALFEKLSKKTFWPIFEYAFKVNDAFLREPLDIFEYSYGSVLYSTEELVAHRSVEELVQLIDGAIYLYGPKDNFNDLNEALYEAIQQLIDDNSVELVRKKIVQLENESSEDTSVVIEDLKKIIQEFEQKRSLTGQPETKSDLKPDN